MNTMKFAICNETFSDLNWSHEKVFEFVADCGYDGIEIAPFTIGDHVEKIPDLDTRQLKDAANNAGISIIGLHWILSNQQDLLLTSSDSLVRTRTAKYLCSLARWCRELGGDIMIFGSPKQRNRPEKMSMLEGFQNASATLETVVPVLEETKVTIAMEPLATWETNFILDASDALHMIEMVDSEFVRMILDCKAMHAMEAETIPTVIRNYAEYFSHFHANDPNLLGPGFGELDFVPIFHALREVEYDRWVSVEVFDYSPGPEKIAKDSFDYMKNCLGQ